MSERPYPLAMSVAQFAEEIGVCENTVWNWIRSGELKSAKFGNRRLVDIQAFKERFKDGSKYGSQPLASQKSAETPKETIK